LRVACSAFVRRGCRKREQATRTPYAPLLRCGVPLCTTTLILFRRLRTKISIVFLCALRVSAVKCRRVIQSSWVRTVQGRRFCLSICCGFRLYYKCSICSQRAATKIFMRQNRDFLGVGSHNAYTEIRVLAPSGDARERYEETETTSPRLRTWLQDERRFTETWFSFIPISRRLLQHFPP